MQIGEEHLAGAQQSGLPLLRLLHLHDEVAGFEDVARPVLELCARPGVGVVRQARTHPRALLDQHPMAIRDQLRHRGRRQADAVFIVLDLAGNADAQIALPCCALSDLAGVAGRGVKGREIVTVWRINGLDWIKNVICCSAFDGLRLRNDRRAFTRPDR